MEGYSSFLKELQIINIISHKQEDGLFIDLPICMSESDTYRNKLELESKAALRNLKPHIKENTVEEELNELLLVQSKLIRFINDIERIIKKINNKFNKIELSEFEKTFRKYFIILSDNNEIYPGTLNMSEGTLIAMCNNIVLREDVLRNLIKEVNKGVRLSKSLQRQENPTLINQHPEIFCNNGFAFFEYLVENFVAQKNKRGHQRDVLFCYHKLFNSTPKYIHQRTQAFIGWYNSLHVDGINQTLTYLQTKTEKREKLYSTTLELFKQNK